MSRPGRNYAGRPGIGANIRGATLPCRHLTDGVRRLLATHRALLAAQP